MKLLVLLLLPCLSLSELSPGFSKCKQFFLENKPPQFTPQWGSSVKEICQCLRDNNNNNNKQPKYLYATLYHTDWRIPIYSAYVFKKSVSVERCNPWYIEPQLDGDANAEACMAPKPKGSGDLKYQAVNCDYYKTGYDRGHLYPVQHTDNDDSMKATSTLTNAAPQDRGFNRGKWRVHEADVIEDLKACDRNVVAYVVTGVVPDDNIPKIKPNNPRVTVSKYYWRAYCCLQNGVYIGKGYFGPDGTDMTVTTLSIADLQTKLATDYNVNKIVIFPGLPAPPPLPPPLPPPRAPKRQRTLEVEDSCIDDGCN